MLENIDLTKKIKKSGYKEQIPTLEYKLGELQRKARELKIPIIIVFEGWDAAGKGTMINRLMISMDPRGYTVNPTNPPNEEELLRPFLWRFWKKTPERGRIAIFDRSWYGKVLVEKINKIVKKKDCLAAYPEICSFERQLTDEGTVIIKFFLHINKNEQKRRFKLLLKNPSTAWKVTKEDWKHHKKYDEYAKAVEEMLEKTDTEYAPWTIIEANDRRFATLKIFNTVAATIEQKINTMTQPSNKSASKIISKSSVSLKKMTSSILDKIDLSISISKDEYTEELKKYQQRIMELEHEAYIRRIPVIILYEGWDSAGKGGNIKRLVRGMDPRGYQVIPIVAPNDIEKNHHYLWRFWEHIPKSGHIAIFDRTWYGRVLVERVEGYCSQNEWKRSYREINEMEEQLTNFGTVLIKFWIHISAEEQLSRFKAREATPHKQWKITDEDWRNRKKWNQYKTAIDEMLFRTSTTYSPWTIVEANSKFYARIKTLKTVVETLEKHIEKER
ncbi:MAG: hypothetical protein P9M03_03310 [Candidatus Theseobacter exili]|nr:hypothetical protein [Candidatus Theseobacter exili]